MVVVVVVETHQITLEAQVVLVEVLSIPAGLPLVLLRILDQVEILEVAQYLLMMLLHTVQVVAVVPVDKVVMVLDLKLDLVE